MIVLDGKKTAIALKEEIKLTVDNRINDGKKIPHLAAVLVGNDGASLTYVGSKVRSCEQIGIKSTLIHLEDTISENELLQKITQLNNDDSLDGYIVQLPLPKHINEEKILLAIDPRKDVDGFHPSNFGRMALEMDSFIPATPYGIMELLKRYKIETSGKHCVVIGRSHIVGRPISILMSQKGPYGNATVTVAHSRTE
ncbi:MAG: bifunctional 5,10-methylenetetrahydrofolate dehydrogenase/5,10-methenyltetrahydrofolate cyclohydrolase, partial [Flavobacteriales bacterium]